MKNTVAKRYAAALYAIARDENLTEQVSGQLDELARVWQDQPDFKSLLTSPKVDLAQKRLVLRELSEKLQFGKSMTSLFNLILDRGRIGIIPALADEFRLLDDTHIGRARAHCISPHPLSEEQLNRLREKLLRITRAKQVLITLEIDPSLLAGFVVSIDGKIFDGSLKGRLQRLGRHLVQPQAETARLR
jgi:F-type H+-transporting ATPase subunit delta